VETNTAREQKTQRPPVLDVNTSRRRALSPHQARKFKRTIIAKFCRAEISAEAVERAFQIFAELRGA
jgi:hypothetical protein